MHPPLSLVIQSFGKQNEYLRAAFAIWSFYAHCTIEKDKSKVLLYTDNPQFFTPLLKNLPVEYIYLTEEKIRSLRGPIDFLHYMKIGIIEDAFSSGSEKIVYCDSDAFFIQDPAPLIAQVNEETVFMHTPEYCFREELGNKNIFLPTKRFIELLQKNSFNLSNGSTVSISLENVSWNAGAMMFHQSHKKFLSDVYMLTEQFYPQCESHASEQFAFSIVLQENTHIKPCDTAIYHYWYRIKKQIADIYFEKLFANEWLTYTEDKKYKTIKSFSLNLPKQFDSHVLMLKDNAIQEFNLDNYAMAYKYSLKAASKIPFDMTFLKDVLYHTKRYFLGSKK